jgi:hypothetical protein
MKIVNPLSINNSEEPIQSVLRCLAGQGGCDGAPYDQMQVAADCIDAQQAEIDRLKAEVLTIRKLLWVGHGHRGLYGDDGELQCAQCSPAYDYKNGRLEDVVRQAISVLTEQVAKWQRAVEAMEKMEYHCPYEAGTCEDCVSVLRAYHQEVVCKKG